MARWLPYEDFKRKVKQDRHDLMSVVSERNFDMMSDNQMKLGVLQKSGKFCVGLFPNGTLRKDMNVHSMVSDFNVGFRSADDWIELLTDRRYIPSLFQFVAPYRCKD